MPIRLPKRLNLKLKLARPQMPPPNHIILDTLKHMIQKPPTDLISSVRLDANGHRPVATATATIIGVEFEAAVWDGVVRVELDVRVDALAGEGEDVGECCSEDWGAEEVVGEDEGGAGVWVWVWGDDEGRVDDGGRGGGGGGGMGGRVC